MVKYLNQYEAIVSSSDDAIISKDLNSIVTSWNKGAEKIFGYTAEEMIGNSITVLFPVDLIHEEAMILSRISSGELVDHFKTKRIRKDGGAIDISVTVSPICDANGTIIGASKVARDITQQVVLEQQALQFQAIINSTEDAIVSKTLDGFIQTWNPAAEIMFGFSAAEAIGQHITLLFPADRIHEEEKLMRAIREGKQVKHFRTTRISKDNSKIYVSVSLSPIYDHNGNLVGVSKIARDVTHELNESLTPISNSHDGLTGLLNRYGMMQCMEELLHLSNIRNKKFALLYLNINHFAALNQQFGFAFGDQVLIEIANVLRKTVRSSDECARLDKDEFLICLMGLSSNEDLSISINKVADAISSIHEVNNTTIDLDISVGVSVFPDDGHSTQALMSRADHAQYSIKGLKGRNVALFSELSNKTFLDEDQLATSLKQAIDNKEIDLLYQPIVNIDTGIVKRVAALAHWRHPSHGIIEASVFIPLAERYGLIRSLDELVLDKALAQLSKWTSLYGMDFQMSINQSQYDLINKELCSQNLLKKLHQYGLKGENIIIEISEGSLIQQSKVMSAILKHYESIGVQVAIDNFGTGYSSLGCLKDYTFSMLKLDRTLVDAIMFNQMDFILVEGILSIAKQLGIQVIAEGVETPEQVEVLHGLGCNLQEGYYFCKPIQFNDFEEFIVANDGLH
ncbi:EAL domain-containing protein [Marinomonas ostreistagni]|uniref:EAL domain-containing protein n=1 Tax=Marinomonas ostreistagni TaxID=359209 RepID=A0ABS0ZCH3_9GAMM|nr:EAL domain-containing protein [Marinomonas ostreistagni]MBJ7551364.1 EAL domain-containing protein [Marinomonas ostreistagni]